MDPLPEEGDDVTDGVSIGYDTDVLQFGGAGLFAAAAATAEATRALQQAPLDPTMFGLTPGAPAFAAAVASARAAQARGFHQEGERATDLADRTGTTAGLGNGLTDRSTTIAGSAPRSTP